MLRLIIEWLGFALVYAGLTMVSTPSSAAMPADQAIRLVNAWEGKAGAAAPARLTVDINGDFSYQARGAFFHFEGAGKRLVVSGLVGQRMLQFTAAKEPWEQLMHFASREQVTLGEGAFQVINAPFFDLVPPALLLRKSFTDGAITNAQFILEVRWLLEWSTHWRTRRLLEIFSADDTATVAQKGAAHVEFAMRHRRRPW